MKKTCATITSLALCLSLMLPTGAVAFAETGGDQAASGGTDAVYVGDSYDSGIAPRTRGNCTDSYSRAWCNSHGYANNRPVGHTVVLNAQEQRCYNALIASGLQASVTSLVTLNASGLLIAAPFIAYNLYNCLY